LTSGKRIREQYFLSRWTAWFKAVCLDSKHLWTSGKATKRLVLRFILSKIRTPIRRKRAEKEINEFKLVSNSLDITTDWFSHNIPKWKDAFRQAKITEDQTFRILEIGSWEGLSAHFLLRFFPLSTFTAVDTWEGGDEHDGLTTVSLAENRFEKNTSSFSDRVFKSKGTSADYFLRENGKNRYRIVYIDGSHRAEDVLNDASSGFALLEVGGLMILDDLLWKFYDDVTDNPAAGINRFLISHAGRLRTIDVGHQLYLIKLN
jgi:predicted O-methyltransferase YrrM